MPHRRRDAPGGLGLSLGLRVGGPRLGGALPVLFGWNAENSQALPSPATFTRNDTKWYRNGSGVWVSAGPNVLRLHNLTVGGGEQGYLPEPAVTKLAVQRRDFTDAAWVKVNGTAARDAVGIDGAANSCSTLTATSANFTALQTVTSASSAHTTQAFVARKTGTGTIEFTIDGGTTWVDITSSLTSNIDNEFRITQTLANPSIGFRIATSGDEIEVDCCDIEATSFGTTPFVQDNVASESRLADRLDTNTAFPAGGFTAFVDATSAPGSTDVVALGTEPNNRIPVGKTTPEYNAFIAGRNIDIGASDWSSRAKVSTSSSNTTGGVDPLYLSATGEATRISTTAAVDSDNMTIGYRSGGAPGEWRGVVHNAILYSLAVTQEENEGLVA